MSRIATQTPEERRAKERERTRRWRLANPDKRAAQMRRDYDKNAEARRAKQREWYRANRQAKGLPVRVARTPEERREAKRLLNQRRYRTPAQIAQREQLYKQSTDKPTRVTQPTPDTEAFMRANPDKVHRIPPVPARPYDVIPARLVVRGRGASA